MSISKSEGLRGLDLATLFHQFNFARIIFENNKYRKSYFSSYKAFIVKFTQSSKHQVSAVSKTQVL